MTLKEQLWDPVAGFGVTFRTMFRKVVTEQYPFEKEPTAPRFHGRHQLNRWPDGLEKCIGCELCAWACPADAIYVEGASNSDDPDGGGRFSPGERYGRVYQINYLRCILCGLCIEACPTRALTMSNEYELADDNRADLIYTKSDLLAPLLPGMEAPPHAMRLGDDEGAYYRGQFRAQSGTPADNPTGNSTGNSTGESSTPAIRPTSVVQPSRVLGLVKGTKPHRVDAPPHEDFEAEPFVSESTRELER